MIFSFQQDFDYSCGVDLHSESFNVYIINLSGQKVQSGKYATVEEEIRKCFWPYQDMSLTRISSKIIVA